MAAGAALGMAQVSLPYAELGIAASVLVLGVGILVVHRDMSPWPIVGLVIALMIDVSPAGGRRKRKE